MTNSPLQLEGYFFTRIEVQAHADGKPEAAPQLKTVAELGKDPADGRYLVTVRVEILRGEGNVNPAYTGQLEIRGIFRTAEGYPAERCDEMVYVNGSSILYGATREMLLNLTARGPWPALMLPSVRFMSDHPEAMPLDAAAPTDPEADDSTINRLSSTAETEPAKTKPSGPPTRRRKR